MRLVAIDPGSEQSAVITLDGVRVLFLDIMPNELLRDWLRVGGGYGDADRPPLALEMIASYGMAVGRTVFETCVWIGVFAEAWSPGHVEYVYRREVKLHLCNSARAKDSNIRQALIDRYGGTRQLALGTKKKPGPLYGVSKDLWAALGVGHTYRARCEGELENRSTP